MKNSNKNNGGKVSWLAKLTPTQAKKVFAWDRAGYSQDVIVKKLFDMYGVNVSQATISNILNRKVYRSVRMI